MRCPDCACSMKTLETREQEDSIRRRRTCPSCGLRLTTYERIAEEVRAKDEPKELPMQRSIRQKKAKPWGLSAMHVALRVWPSSAQRDGAEPFKPIQ